VAGMERQYHVGGGFFYVKTRADLSFFDAYIYVQEWDVFSAIVECKVDGVMLLV
jgi:hypothetical protein